MLWVWGTAKKNCQGGLHRERIHQHSIFSIFQVEILSKVWHGNAVRGFFHNDVSCKTTFGFIGIQFCFFYCCRLGQEIKSGKARHFLSRMRGGLVHLKFFSRMMVQWGERSTGMPAEQQLRCIDSIFISVVAVRETMNVKANVQMDIIILLVSIQLKLSFHGTHQVFLFIFGWPSNILHVVCPAVNQPFNQENVIFGLMQGQFLQDLNSD